MFIITQFIGLFVISIYLHPGNTLPFNMQPPEEINPNDLGIFFSIFIAFAIAISLFFILTRINAEKLIRFWFFIVTALAIGLTLKALFFVGFKDILINNPIPIFSFIVPRISIFSIILFFIICLPLAYIKIFKRNIFIHNLTELLIYPGIAAVFIPILNILGIIILLLAISIYDIWAVWHSEFMQKMAHYQINTLRFFTGFFIPYANKKEKEKIKLLKDKYKNKSEKLLQNKFKEAKIKVNLAILGGGDIIFPIITAGIFYKYIGLIPALIITLSATISLLYLFVFAKKGKFYPAMPFLSSGMYIGMIIVWILMSLHII
jgi:presenilin-like A22 family membrane protease